jgi:hypothetical protein
MPPPAGDAPRRSHPAAVPLQREREHVLVERAVARVVEELVEARAGLHLGHLRGERALLEDRVEAALGGAHREAQQRDPFGAAARYPACPAGKPPKRQLGLVGSSTFKLHP